MKEPVWRNPPALTELEGVARMGYFQNIYNLSTEDCGPKRDALMSDKGSFRVIAP